MINIIGFVGNNVATNGLHNNLTYNTAYTNAVFEVEDQNLWVGAQGTSGFSKTDIAEV